MANYLDNDIKFVAGVGEARARLLEKELGIRTLGDMLCHYPFRYIDRTRIYRIDSRKLGFEGGQMPLQRRLPKFGFTNLKRVEFKAINLSTLEELAAKKSLTEVTVDTLIAAGFISSNDKVKILGNGTISKALAVKAHAFSKSAEAAITAAGGSVEKL